MRWKFGVSMGPPNVLLAPNPTSSVKIRRTFGAPCGASTPFGKSGVESFTVRPIWPLKGGSGCGKTACPNTGDASTSNKRDKHIDRAHLDMCLSSTSAMIFAAVTCRTKHSDTRTKMLISSRSLPIRSWLQRSQYITVLPCVCYVLAVLPPSIYPDDLYSC